MPIRAPPPALPHYRSTCQRICINQINNGTSAHLGGRAALHAPRLLPMRGGRAPAVIPARAGASTLSLRVRGEGRGGGEGGAGRGEGEPGWEGRLCATSTARGRLGRPSPGTATGLRAHAHGRQLTDRTLPEDMHRRKGHGDRFKRPQRAQHCPRPPPTPPLCRKFLPSSNERVTVVHSVKGGRERRGATRSVSARQGATR